jgi:glucose-6-phosphate isomerase
VGYYHLPKLGAAIIDRAKALKEKRNKMRHIVVIGIGGSSLGTKAVAKMLTHESDKEACELHFLENLDPWSVDGLLKSINLMESFFLIVSKSGSTIETISLAKVVMAQMGCLPGSFEFADHFGIITDEGSPLDKFGEQFGLEVFHIPQNVGGRFSVLSAAGLVPLHLAGFDTNSFLEGANACKIDFVDNTNNEAILQKAYRYAIHKQASINVLFSYGDAFREFNAWYTQLWAESLGKKHGFARMGLTPVGLIGSVDQHSFLQLIMEGPRDKTVTFLRIKDWNKRTPIPNLKLPFLDNTNYSNGLSIGSVLNAQCGATMQSIIQEGITTDIIELDSLDAWHVGYLMYYYEVLTSTCGLMLGINTYDQPGVEVGKRILKNILGARR